MEKRIAAALVLVFLGLFVPYWPLAFCGVLALVFFDRWFLGLLCALLLDIAYGPSTGFFHLFVLPFTFFALFLTLVRMAISPYLRPGSPYSI